MKLLALAFGALVATFALSGTAHAQIVTSWHDRITVNQDGSLNIQETIVYDPQDSSHHGIIRDIPATTKDAAGHKYYSIFTFGSVTDENGKRHPIAEKTVNRQHLYLKIGDKDTFITPGPHTYVITYTMKLMVMHTDGGDRLNLNIIGTGWDTPVTTATAEITLPGGARVESRACFTGPAGSTASDCAVRPSSAAGVVANTTRLLAAGEAFTVDLALSSLGLGAYLEPDVRPPLSAAELAGLALAGLGLLFLLAGIGAGLYRKYAEHHQNAGHTIIPIYEPPAGLTPAHMSILESPAADVADITATLIHLAVRGAIKIEQTRPKSWWRQADYRFIRLDSTQPLAHFEQTLLDGMFGGQTETSLDDLKGRTSTKLSQAITKFREILGDDLKTKDLFVTSPTGWLGAARVGVGLFVAMMFIPVVATSYEGDAGMVLVFGLITTALSAAFLALMLKPSGRTVTGSKELAGVKGFKWFLEVTEKDRLAFTDAPEKTPELFSKMLPYAIALKVEKQWAKQFENIDVSKAVGAWYAGASIGHFSAGSFTDSFSSSFGGAMSSGFSGASGGGSAGGGGGGGGGGGW